MVKHKNSMKEVVLYAALRARNTDVRTAIDHLWHPAPSLPHVHGSTDNRGAPLSLLQAGVQERAEGAEPLDPASRGRELKTDEFQLCFNHYSLLPAGRLPYG